MNPKKLFPLFVTDKLAETKTFYTEKAGFKITFDMDHYLSVRYGDKDGPELAFAASESEALGKMPVFGGEGIIVSIPTKDADRKAREMESHGVKLMSPSETRPWEWRSFMTRDPNGVILDFFHVPAENAGADATQNNLGNALSTLGQRRMNIRVLCGALEAPERPGAFLLRRDALLRFHCQRFHTGRSVDS